MRNLKRALSLVLAVVMVIGLMVVGASAVSYNDFSDRGEIVNKDAVSMLTTLEIIQGQPDGSYNPSGNVDRAQMAKMISVMLTNNQNCDTLYTNVDSGLTDIAANWARGFINYCYVRGIIAGRGNNTFDPSANVTGVEAAKMLLAALGYNAEIEGLVGPDWALNTAALAQQLGIFRNFTKDVSEPLNRDDAALLIYNALDVELIQEYRNGYAISYDDHRTVLSSVFGVMRVEGIVVANEWAALDGEGSETALREGRTTLDNVVVYDSTTANTVVEEGVRQDGEVPFNVTTPVEYLGKAVTMYIEKTTVLSNSKVIGVATKDDMNVIHFTADGADTVKDYLKGTGVAVSDTETDYYLNYGYMDDAEAAIDWINDYAVEDSKGNDFALNGVEVEVIDNDDDGTAEYVLYLQETMSEVNRVNASNETVAFYTPDRDTRSMLDGTTSVTTVDLEDVVYADSVSLEGVATTDTIELAAEDLILYVQYGGRTYVYLPEYVTGTMTRIDRDQSNEQYITLDNGETYYQSYIIDAASMVDVDLTRFFVARAREDVGFDTMYDFILDSHGYVVAVRPAEEVVTNYALVLDSAWTQNALRYGGQVEVLMADGTTETYDINWNESRKAFDGIQIDIDGNGTINSDEAASANSNSQLNGKLEAYLGSRDVVIGGVDQSKDDGTDSGNYKTGAAAGSIITYSLNEAGDELTIESVLQGNNFEDDLLSSGAPNNTLEIDDDADDVDLETTAGVGDNSNIIYMDGIPNSTSADKGNLQYVTYRGYTNGSGEIRVESSASTAAKAGDPQDVSGRTVPKTYAVDQNTVAFYYYKTTDGYVYGVATGWEDMISVDRGVDVQVYPALRKTSNHTYVASDLAAVILFEVEPAALSDDYMLVLSANALGKDTLELTVVFEDGTVDAITIDDQGDFDEDRDNHFMKAWSYTENEDGTYDIGSMWSPWGVADLLRVGTIDLRAYGENGAHKYLSLPSDANVWDVTETKTSGDEVAVGHYQENVLVNTVAITDAKGQVRTAWMWDYDGTTDGNIDYNFTWTLDNYVEIYAYEPVFMQQMKLAQAYSNDQNVMYIGNLSLNGGDYGVTDPVITGDLYIPEGMIFQIEGNLTETGTNGVVGGGTLRVAGTYTVNNDNYDNITQSAITVNTQVGRDNTDDLILSDDTVISARVGVNGDVAGIGGYIGRLGVTGSLFANGDVNLPASQLIVNGHVEADNVHINNGYVNSSNTLIALGDICLHNGTLTIGNPTDRGVVYVYGDIVDSHSAGDVGNVIVNNGVLYLGFESEIALDQTATTGGDVTVNASGAIEQDMGYINGITADDVTIDGGDVTLSGTINANTLTIKNGADVTVVGDPSPYTAPNYSIDSTSTIDVLAGTDVEEPSVPTTDLRLEFVTVKIGDKTYDVRLNHTNHTGSVELSYADFDKFDDPNANGVVAYEPNDNKATVDVSDNFTSTGDGTKAFTVTLKKTVTNNGITSDTTVVYTITATQAAGNTDATLDYLAIKGVEVDLTNPTGGDGTSESERIVYTVNVDAAANSNNEEMIVAEAGDATVIITTTQGDAWSSNTGTLNGSEEWYIQVTSQDGKHHTYYDVDVNTAEAAWTGIIGSVWYYDATPGAANGGFIEATGVSVKGDEPFDTDEDLSFTATAPAGYYITGFRYRIGGQEAQWTTVSDPSGNYTIESGKLNSVTSDNPLHIHVLVTPNPVVSFEGGMAKEVDSGAGWTQSISVEYGDTLYFNLQDNGTVTIDSQYAGNYKELHGSDDYWYITDVTGDITVTVRY